MALERGRTSSVPPVLTGFAAPPFRRSYRLSERSGQAPGRRLGIEMAVGLAVGTVLDSHSLRQQL